LLNANLQGADLSFAYLIDTVLSNAKLSYADLLYADLRFAKLSYADLSYAYLLDANLSHADLLNTDVNGAVMSRSLLFKNLGLETLKLDPATKFHDSLTDSEGFVDHLKSQGIHGLPILIKDKPQLIRELKSRKYSDDYVAVVIKAWDLG